MKKLTSYKCREHRLLFRGEVPSQEPEAKEQQPRQKAGFDAERQNPSEGVTRGSTVDYKDGLKRQMPKYQKLIEDSSKYIDIRFCPIKDKNHGVYLFKKGSDTPVFRDNQRYTKGDLIQALQILNNGDGKDALSTEDYGSIKSLSAHEKVAAYVKNPKAFEGPVLEEVKQSIMKDLNITEPILLMDNPIVTSKGTSSQLSVCSKADRHILATVYVDEKGNLLSIINKPKFEELTSASLTSLVANATSNAQEIGRKGTRTEVSRIEKDGRTVGYTVELWIQHTTLEDIKGRVGEVEFDTQGKIVKSTKIPSVIRQIK